LEKVKNIRVIFGSSEEEFEKVTDEKIIDEKIIDEKISYDPPPGLDFENHE
jgi:hypothetical protein